MSVLQKAYNGTLKKHPCLCTLVILVAVLATAWKLVLRPQPLRITVQEISINNWNVSRGSFNHRETALLTSGSRVEFEIQNPSLCWRFDVKHAKVEIMLVTPHFRYPLGSGEMKELHAEAHSRRFVRVYLQGVNVPLLQNSRYIPSQGSPFRLLFRTVFRSTPRAKWFWVPFHYKYRFNCQLTCSMKPVKLGTLKLVVLRNQCGLS